MCSCHYIPECCVMFSGVKLSMGSFILLFRLFFIKLENAIAVQPVTWENDHVWGNLNAKNGTDYKFKLIFLLSS